MSFGQGDGPMDSEAALNDIAGGSDLVRYLDANLDAQPATLLSTLDAIVDEGYLLAYLIRARHSDELARLARLGEPEAHPNGFAKVCIASRPGEWILRLHTWSHGGGDADIHSHRWDFASRILVGALRARSYSVASRFGSYVQLICRRNSQGGYAFQTVGSCSIIQTAERVYFQYESYLQHYDDLHSVATVGAAPLVTVVLQGPFRSDHSTVVVDDRSAQPVARAIVPLTIAQIHELLLVAAKALPR
jgi:hypothetical protein